jgi:hypothetical protein
LTELYLERGFGLPVVVVCGGEAVREVGQVAEANGYFVMVIVEYPS